MPAMVGVADTVGHLSDEVKFHKRLERHEGREGASPSLSGYDVGLM